MDATARLAKLEALAGAAHAAQESGDDWAANELWRRHRLVRDGGRDPDELLAEGMELIRVARDLAAQNRS